jgi:hypothetical protein
VRPLGTALVFFDVVVEETQQSFRLLAKPPCMNTANVTLLANSLRNRDCVSVVSNWVEEDDASLFLATRVDIHSAHIQVSQSFHSERQLCIFFEKHMRGIRTILKVTCLALKL